MRNKPVTFAMLFILLAAALPAATVATPAPPDPLDKVEPLVLEEIAAAGRTDFFVWMTEKADLSPAERLQTKLEKGRFVYETLVATAERTQQDLRAALDRQGVRYKAFYIANKVLVYSSDRKLLVQIAARPDVARITANHPFQLQDPVEQRPAPDHTEDVGSNLTFIKAPQSWALGHTGLGTVLAGNDTGIDETHPAIARHYRGCLNPPACTLWDHNYNWWDATDTYPGNPDDGNGHGTHTTGTMVGDDGGTNHIGVAPGAQTIHCKNMYDSGSGNDATFTECFQWDLAPWDLSGANPRPDLAPDAINNSWGYYGGGYNQFRDEILALQAAGIVVEVSAGNEGPNCATLRSPGDYNEVLSTGSVWHYTPFPGRITGFSSRGPSDLDPTPPYYFPDVMAPGEYVRSSWTDHGYLWGSGTSMAGPHVTALVGLLWSANPALRGQVALTQQIIQDTSVPLTGQGGSNCGGDYTAGPNNDWGHGTIDALAAVQAALSLGATGHLHGHVYDAVSAEPIENATVLASLAGGSASVQTDAAGYYTMTALAGTYTVTASAFNSVPATVGGVVIITGTTTARDFNLTPLPTYVVSGTVSDAAGGAPLSATVRVLYTPLVPVHSDPATGFYALRVVPGTYTFLVEAWGYRRLTRTVVVGQDQTLDGHLEALPFVPDERNPVLESGLPGTWDDYGIAYFDVVNRGGPTYMFYTGLDWDTGRYAIGYATSTNGLDFDKSPANPILAGDGSGFDSYAVWVPQALVEDGTWVLYYAGNSVWSDIGLQVGRAEAPAPSGPWTRSDVPVLPKGSPGEWDSGSVCPSRVLRTADGYVMYYLGFPPSFTGLQVGMATSTDGGISWTRYDDPSTPNHPYAESDPVVKLGPPGAWDDTGITGGYARPTASGWEMLYSGWDEFTTMAVGYATSVDGVHWHKYGQNPVLEPADDPLATFRVSYPAFVMSDTTYLVYYDYIAPAAISLATGPGPCMPLAEALFSWQPVTPTAGHPVTFTASAAGTDPVAFTWDLGDGSTATGRVISHTYAASGTYKVTLTATNCQTGTATVEHPISVQPRCAPGAGPLLVDDDGNSPDVRAYYTTALDRLGVDYAVWDTAASGPPAVEDLQCRDTIIWFTGAGREDTFTAADEAVVVEYLNAGSWYTETVDSAECSWYSGSCISLALDGARYPHIAYHGPSGLAYAYLDATGWHTTTVDVTIRCDGFADCVSLVLDAAGYPHIAYDNADGLAYAYLDAMGWHTETVASGTEDLWYSPALALDAAGYPHIGYSRCTPYELGGGASCHDLAYAYLDAAGWHTETVEGGDYGWHVSLALDVAAYPHLAYGSCGWGVGSMRPWCDGLRYAYLNVSGWHTETVESGDVGWRISAALDSSGYPHIGYTDLDNWPHWLRYAHLDASGWHTATVLPGWDWNSSVSLSLGGSGYPAIVGNGVTYTYLDATGWHTETVDPLGGAGSLALDLGSSPHIAYAGAGGLTYATRSPDSHFFLSSEDYLHEMGLTAFGQDALGIITYTDDVSPTDVTGTPGSPIGDGLGPYTLTTPPGWSTLWTDAVSGTQSPFRWQGSGLNNSTNYDGVHFRTVFFGWPLEGLADLDDRAAVLCAVLGWFGECPAQCNPVHDTGFSWQPVTPTVGLPVTFTGTVAGGDAPITYTWELDVGGWKEGQVVTYTYSTAGVYTVALTATNCAGAIATATHPLTVQPPPCAPVEDADFTWQPITPTVDEAVAFTATATATRPLTFTWSWGDGDSSSAPCPLPLVTCSFTHTYSAPDLYTVTMTATNDCGAWQAVTDTLTVTPTCQGVSIVSVTTAISGCAVTFGAGLAGTPPFTYLWDLGPFGTSTATNPLVDFVSGTYAGVLSVWNCGNLEPATNTFTVEVACAREYSIYLPIVLRNYP